MASSSNSEFKCSYDIFLSFRGSDTRNQFTDHLYEALKREGFETFRDNEGIERGENINSELQKAIRNSSMSVIVLSKTYATSKSCLFEIQTILEHHKKKSDHVIFPVFYEVEPSEIKEQAKNLDFRGKKVTDEEVKGWSAGLKEVAKMGGFVYFNNRSEAKFIEEIIGALKSKQADKHSRDLNDNMQNLKRKLEDLSGQEDDIKTKISNAERWQGKRPKKEVEVWRRNVQRVKDNVRRLEQKVDGETNVSSCMRLEKDIATQILEVQEFHKKGRDFNSPMIDELPTGRLSIPPVKDFVRCTKARNTENIWECVMKDDVTKIGVYGMGGVGKTTIMKDIYNQLLGKFDNVYWVTVSKAFDITNLQSRILKSLNLTLKEDEEEISKASRLYATLSRQKRYVLILDDIWEPFSLEVVGIPEPIRHNGCKLVLTTRSLEVCQTMDCTPVKVHLFTEKEALTLFLTKAVGHDTVLAPEVEEIAAKIAKECACLPLAIVTIAGSLRGLKGIREWRNALNELISSTKDASGDVNKVFERLKFSYSRLGNKVLQDCFLYCSLYPEDYKIPVNELIEYWIVEELITDMDSVEAQFDKGHAILGKLTSSCLLESFSNVSKREYVRMHDLIRDMALRIATNRPRFRVKAGERLQSIPYEVWYEDLDKASFMHCYISELPIRPPICPRLTTLLLREVTTNFPLTFPNDFFINMPCLTVLDLSFCNIEKLPESISNLENLHALLLEVCGRLADVPSVKKLKALKVFKLTYSEIEELPEGIEELINLRKLDLSHNMGLGPFPSRLLRKLSKLQYLRTDGTKIQLSVEDLLCLKQLKVVSVRFHNVQELNSYVRSRQLQGMEKYCLIVGKGYFDIWDLGKEVHIGLLESVPSGSVVDDLVFPADINYFELRRVHDLVSLSAIPCWNGARDLRECTVRRCYGLECIFSEDGQISLGTVESLTLDKLPSFRVLFDRIAPPHNIYSNLKKLDFWDCHTVKNIFPVQFLQNFPNLESLSAYRCENLEDIISETVEMSDWGNHEDDSNTISLPKLKVLCLFDLPSLKSIYNGMMVCHSIEEVDVRKCPLVRRLPLSLHMDSEQATAPPALKSIRANDEWWESLVWDDPRAKQILQPLRQPGRKYLDDYDHYQNDDSEDSDNFFDEDSKDYDNYSNEDSEDYDNYSDEDSISTLVDSFSRMYIS